MTRSRSDLSSRAGWLVRVHDGSRVVAVCPCPDVASVLALAEAIRLHWPGRRVTARRPGTVAGPVAAVSTSPLTTTAHRSPLNRAGALTAPSGERYPALGHPLTKALTGVSGERARALTAERFGPLTHSSHTPLTAHDRRPR